LTTPRGASGRFPAISGVDDAVNLKCLVNPVQTGLLHPANVSFPRDYDPDLRSTPIDSSWRSCWLFSGSSGVGDAGNLKCRLTPAKTRLVCQANVGFFHDLDPDLL